MGRYVAINAVPASTSDKARDSTLKKSRPSKVLDVWVYPLGCLLTGSGALITRITQLIHWLSRRAFLSTASAVSTTSRYVNHRVKELVTVVNHLALPLFVRRHMMLAFGLIQAARGLGAMVYLDMSGCWVDWEGKGGKGEGMFFVAFLWGFLTVFASLQGPQWGEMKDIFTFIFGLFFCRLALFGGDYV